MPEIETLTEVRGDLVLAALCIGQFRAPCQIDPDRLLVRSDEPLLQALGALGLQLSPVREGLTPAPMFAPDTPTDSGASAGQTLGRRHVHTHISRHHDDEAPDEQIADASNA